jgi:hypothetical protein
MRQLAMVFACALLFLPVSPEGFSRALPSNAETAVAPKVLHVEGLLHGFLLLRSVEGEVRAEGEITQVAHGDKLKTSLVFHFKDTSLYQEDVVFSQRRVFRVFSYHLTQKGPAFIWVLSGEAPAYLKSEGPLYMGGPVWRIELLSPAWKNK